MIVQTKAAHNGVLPLTAACSTVCACGVVVPQAVSNRLEEGVLLARAMWLEENDPKDGTDCVTPFDEFLYRGGR